MLVNPGTYVMDGFPSLQGTISGGGSGAALEPDGRTGYRVNGSNLEILNVFRFLVSGSVPLADSQSTMSTASRNCRPTRAST